MPPAKSERNLKLFDREVGAAQGGGPGFLLRFADLGQPFGGIGVMGPHGFFDGPRPAREHGLVDAVVPLKKLDRKSTRLNSSHWS